MSRRFAVAVLLLAAAAAPSSAHATGFGGGGRDLGIVLQPRGDRMAFRFDTSGACRTAVRGTVAREYWRFAGSGDGWRLRGELRDASASGRLWIAGCGTRRFRASTFVPARAEAPRPRKGGAYGGMSLLPAGDGLLSPLTLRVSRDGRGIGGRLTLKGSCPGAPGALAVAPMRIRRNRTFGGSSGFGRGGRLTLFGRIVRNAAVGVVRVRSGRCDTGKLAWGAGLLRFIRTDEPVSPFAFEIAERPPITWPVPGTWSLDMVSDPGDPPDFIGLGGRYSFASPRGTLSVSGPYAHWAYYSVEVPGASYWTGDFSAPLSRPTLRPGTYEGARRSLVREGDEPGMDVGGDHRGCNDILGRYTIHELARAPDGFLSALHVTFEQHCEFEEPALRGEFRFRAS